MARQLVDKINVRYKIILGPIICIPPAPLPCEEVLASFSLKS